MRLDVIPTMTVQIILHVRTKGASIPAHSETLAPKMPSAKSSTIDHTVPVPMDTLETHMKAASDVSTALLHAMVFLDI